ncbi:MAG: 1-deoxy-D-xylulose-5-phosphate synthase, partial [Desulfobacula sp.]|nr:1-deoxy-D-xylulose-5-phosphate synthase [Desulfobacula sp.]
KNPVYFHGVGSFSVDTGKSTHKSNGIPTYTQVFGSQMIKLAKTNEKIVAVTAAMPEGTGLIEFSKLYPDRFFDVGIAEQHAVTFSAGLASRGLKPVVAIYSTFLQRGYDQILHDVCIDAHPVVFAIDRAGIVGEDGPTHNGLFDYSYLRCMPNMTIMAPNDENELARMLVTAVNHNGPVAIRYPRGTGTGVQIEDNPQPLEIGKAQVINEGDDLLIIAIGKSVCEAVKANKLLTDKGISATIINARFVKPLDTNLIIESVLKIKKIIIVEEHVLDGGFGSAVLEMLADNGVTDFLIKRIGIKNKFVEHGPQDILRRDYEIDYTAILNAALELHGNKAK